MKDLTFKIIISSEKIKTWLNIILTTSQYTITHILYFKNESKINKSYVHHMTQGDLKVQFCVCGLYEE